MLRNSLVSKNFIGGIGLRIAFVFFEWIPLFFFLDRMNEKERAPKEFENPVQISITCSKLPSFPYLYSILLLRIFKYYSSYRMVLRI